MKKKQLLTLFIALLFTSYAKATTDTIAPVQMKYVKSFDKALQMAQKTQKPIFINCYAGWALPCVGMDQAVFNNKPFADWMDKHFVNLWLDMAQSEEGKKIAEKYNVTTFAQYLIIDAKGDIIHRIIGGDRLPAFKQTVAKALSPSTSLRGMNQTYDKGEKKNDTNFLREYLKVLYKAGERDKYKNLLQQYWTLLPQEDKYKSENWEFITREMKDTNSPMFVELENNKKKFLKHNADSTIMKQLEAIYGLEFFYAAVGEKYDSKQQDALYTRATKAGVPSDAQAFVFYNIGKLKHQKKYTQLIQLLQATTPKMDERYAERIDYALATTPQLNKNEQKIIKDYFIQKTKQPKYKNRSIYKNILKKLNQQEGINFATISFEQAIQKAKQTQQLIFVDAYTTWCGPCKMMANNIFVLKEVGDIFNKKFINLKIDMEKGEGKALAKKYNVTAYPTFLLINPNGTLEHKAIGAMDKDKFIASVIRGTDPNTSYHGVKAKYPIMKNNKQFMVDYCLTLAAAGESIHATPNMPSRFSSNDAIEVLTPLTIEERTQKSAWILFNDYITTASLDDPLIRDFFANKTLFTQKIGEEAVNNKLLSLALPQLSKELFEKSSSEEWLNVGKQLALLGEKSIVNIIYRIISLSRDKKHQEILSIYNHEVKPLPYSHTKAQTEILLLYLFDSKTEQSIKKSVNDYVSSQIKVSTDKNAKEFYNDLQLQLNEKFK